MANAKTILGFIAGASIGAIVGILLASDTGRATRKKIIDRSGDIKDAIKDNVSGFMDKVQNGPDQETDQPKQYSIPKMNNDII